VATVVWAAGALDALAAAHGQGSAGAAAAGAIVSAIALLAAHPLAGPRLRGYPSGDLRALVIGHGAAGHVALYRFLPLRQEVRVLAIRGQRALHFRP
jgi:toxin ParE1/3/4